MKRELHEKGKFDDLKQYWADVKGIEKAQTVHELFEVYNEVQGNRLNMKNLKKMLRDLQCRNFLVDIKELHCASEYLAYMDMF